MHTKFDQFNGTDPEIYNIWFYEISLDENAVRNGIYDHIPFKPIFKYYTSWEFF